jgi:hypothetical protein
MVAFLPASRPTGTGEMCDLSKGFEWVASGMFTLILPRYYPTRIRGLTRPVIIPNGVLSTSETEDLKRRGLEGMNDTDAESEAHERGEALQL